MAGKWVCVNPKKAVNDEHWMAPRGNHMLGTFRQDRRDGKPAFVELSLVTVEADDSVALRLRHLRGLLEVPDRRKEVSLFKLKAAADNRAEFTGTGTAEDVTSVVYRLSAPDELTVEIGFAPTSKERGFASVYRRDGR
jgi:hypothetical protein